MEAHDEEELRLQERAVAREAAWRRRVDQRALALDPPGWLVAELGPVPADPQERRVWRVAAAELDGYRRAYGLDDPEPAKHRWGREPWDGRVGSPATPAAVEQAGGSHWRSGRHRRSADPHGQGDRGRRLMVAADRRYPVDPGRLLGAQPGRQAPGRRRDWQAAQAALERLAGWGRHRHDRGQPHLDRAAQEEPGRRLDRTGGRQERDGR
jgi:hypothetical protein